MTDKSALLNQLRIERAPARESGRGWLLWGFAGLVVAAAARERERSRESLQKGIVANCRLRNA